MINLDENFSPLGIENAVQFQSFVFAGGEPHIKISGSFDPASVVQITHRINSFNDLGLICTTVDALKRMGVKAIKLFVPYFPAARQDRVMIPGEPLTVKVYADIINALGLDNVTVFDPHSEVTPALLNNCTVTPNHVFIQKVVAQIGGEVKLISPDGGALKKIYKVSEFLGGAEVVECSKSRDVKTGKLSGFKVYADDLKGADCLIVDDICDGGGTFIGLAEELKNKNAGHLYLAISHGIFSKGFNELGKYFDQVFTTDSIKEIDHVVVTQLKLTDIL
ncbi:ribose-phosphate pyrophosphokinase [Pedobacter sp. HDW13]|uniref:ribose-phosphate diphosphokinase n=1 Tax=unclassified Pedobacter TaxID=2628915 RepID=UPI000F5951B1|nr:MULTISPECIES: ribose-phosphate diphosphokinase [unclassified Pedobacter]QIL41050.1 ribose-phosphate pyrophosphokinase [Pedobacter sp. HDW13]RQO65047.1 phosphoribosylpyrophosphate synthetase [Pedobacter sp. KBW01]